MDERLNKTYSSIQARLFTHSLPHCKSTPPCHCPSPYAHASVKHAQEASLPLGHFMDTVSINALAHQPPTTPPPPLWGCSCSCPWLHTLSAIRQRCRKWRDKRGGGCMNLGDHILMSFWLNDQAPNRWDQSPGLCCMVASNIQLYTCPCIH